MISAALGQSPPYPLAEQLPSQEREKKGQARKRIGVSDGVEQGREAVCAL